MESIDEEGGFLFAVGIAAVFEVGVGEGFSVRRK